MKLLSYVLIAVIVVSGASVVAAQDKGRGRGQGQDRGRRDGPAADSRAPNRAAPVRLVFSERDTTFIRTHYGKRFKNLPPGLQKKLARGGSLPPGWEKKIEAFPPALERNLIVLPSGQRRGIYDGHAVIYDPVSRAILDVVSLF